MGDNNKTLQHSISLSVPRQPPLETMHVHRFWERVQQIDTVGGGYRRMGLELWVPDMKLLQNLFLYITRAFTDSSIQ